LGNRKPSRSGGTRDRAEGIDGQRQLGKDGGVAAQSVDDDAGHLTTESLGCEEFTKYRMKGAAGVDDQDIAGAALLQTGEYGH
jgi:hypothetical protein